MNRQRHTNRQRRGTSKNDSGTPPIDPKRPWYTPHIRGGNDRGPGRGRGQGRGRGTGSPSSSSSRQHEDTFARRDAPRYHAVPSIAQVVAGAHVSIVLKQDQGTGREVSGFVGDVLTSGDHPRGIKVRLADGRVGRVQRIVRGGGDSGDDDDDREGGREGGSVSFEARGEASGRGGRSRGRGRGRGRGKGREDGDSDRVGYGRHGEVEDGVYEGDKPPERSLAAFFPAEELLDVGPRESSQESQQPATSSAQRATSDDDAELSVCPICYEFKGDEAAVTHHVDSHFS